jgi:hypothetical protein
MFIAVRALVRLSPQIHRGDAEARADCFQFLIRRSLPIALAPAIKRLQNGAKRLALLGEEVLIAGRVAFV